jgi:hypothetical protein
MTKQSVSVVALALATATLSAQAPKPAAAPAAKPANAAPKSEAPQPQKAQNQYVPAIMQKLVTVTGCLKRGSDWELIDATLAGQQEKATYKLEGISGARLSLFVGKRIEATGAPQGEARAAGGKSLLRFEATAVQEATGACS